MVCYFIVMNDFGFTMSQLWYLNGVTGVLPNDTDVYDPDSPTLGNSNLNMSDCEVGNSMIGSDVVDWLYVKDSLKDLRMFYVECFVDSVSGLKRF